MSQNVQKLVNDFLFAKDHADAVKAFFGIIGIFDSFIPQNGNAHQQQEQRQENFIKLVSDLQIDVHRGSYTHALKRIDEIDVCRTPEQTASAINLLPEILRKLQMSMTEQLGVPFPDPRATGADQMYLIRRRVILLEACGLMVNKDSYSRLLGILNELYLDGEEDFEYLMRIIYDKWTIQDEIAALKESASDKEGTFYTHINELAQSADKLRTALVEQSKSSDKKKKDHAVRSLQQLAPTLRTIREGGSRQDKEAAIRSYKKMLIKGNFWDFYKTKIINAFITAALVVVGTVVGFVLAGPPGATLGAAAGCVAASMVTVGMWRKASAADFVDCAEDIVKSEQGLSGAQEFPMTIIK